MKLPITIIIIIFLFFYSFVYLTPPVHAFWFRTIGGNIHSDQNINMGTPVDITRYASETNTDFPNRGHSGIISHKTGTYSENGSRSQPVAGQWVKGNTGNTEMDRYKNFYQRFATEHGLARVSYNTPCTPPSESGVYEFTSNNITMNCGVGGLNIPPNKYYVFLVKQDLTIASKVQVPASSFLMIIVGKNLTITSAVPAGTLADPAIEGVFFADQDFTTDAAASQLFLEGVFVAKRFDLKRQGTPGEVFIHNPNYYIRMPGALRHELTEQEEVAP